MIGVLILKKGRSGLRFNRLLRKFWEENLVADRFRSLRRLLIVKFSVLS